MTQKLPYCYLNTCFFFFWAKKRSITKRNQKVQPSFHKAMHNLGGFDKGGIQPKQRLKCSLNKAYMHALESLSIATWTFGLSDNSSF
jgi:hypothetical protein